MADKLGTFSILAISENPKLVGVAVASGSALVGAVATQAYTNIAYGVEGLRLLEMGFSPAEVLNKMLAEDSERELRQVAFIDFVGRKAVFTGSNVPWFRGEVVGKDYTVVGNLLKNSMVLKSMAAQFENSSGDLALRMAKALRAGSESGGDKRGEKSAALIVVSNKQVEVNLRIDFHENPVMELLRQLEAGLS